MADTPTKIHGYVERDPGDMSIDELYGRGSHEEGILAEQELAESRVLLEGPPTPTMKPIGFFETLRRFREASKCPTCGKCTQVLNAARRGFKPETVTAATHCTCAGGPAYELDAPDPARETVPTDSEGAES